MRYGVLILWIWAITGCSGYRYPELISNEGVKFIKMDGREITFKVNTVVHNPNGFSLKVKPSEVFITADGQPMGTIQLSEKVRLKRKSTDTLQVPLIAKLEQGALLSVFRLSQKDSVKIEIKGKVKGGVSILSKKLKIDYVRMIPGSSLKFGMGN